VAAAVEVESYDAGCTFVVGSILVHGPAPAVLCSRRMCGFEVHSAHPEKTDFYYAIAQYNAFFPFSSV
jgi:hypothetical protein